jgi:hypothetical protein
MITDTNAVLSWKAAPYQTPRYLDGYIVTISTLSNDIYDFTDTIFTAAEYLSTVNASLPFLYSSYSFSSGFVHGQDSTYTEFNAASDSARLTGVLRPFSVSLKQYAGQKIFICFNHRSVDDNLIEVDDILVKGTNNVGIKEEFTDISFSTFPNPATDKLTINLSVKKSGSAKINLFDIAGKSIYAENLGNLNQGNYNRQINLAGLAAGAYQLQISTSNGVATKKVIIQ